MHIGIQLEAPEGFELLKKGVVYHWISSDEVRGRVIFVEFSKEKPYVNLVTLNLKRVDEALDQEQIVPCKIQKDLPPWLANLEGVDLSSLDDHRPHAKFTYAERVTDRLAKISLLLANLQELLGAEDPFVKIVRFASKHCKKSNPERLRLWFLTYIAFGRDMWALCPKFPNIGHYDRHNNEDALKPGRPAKHGKSHGYRATPEMIDKIVTGYKDHVRVGRFMTVIYRMVQTEVFGCKTRKNEKGVYEYFHPEGKPFPRYGQFRYYVHKHFGRDTVQKTLYGETRHRNRLAEALGSFSEEAALLMEHIEVDVYHVKELPRGLGENETLPPLCVARAKDIRSGMIVGIGFSLGSETMHAYRMMFFSMAVDKVFFCSLFGLKIDPSMWPSVGLPSYTTFDRGPGASEKLIEDFMQRFPIVDLTPSYEARSKSTIEGSHPRELEIEGRPGFVQSNMNPIQLVRREIERVLLDNASSDRCPYIGPEDVGQMAVATPNEVWELLSRRLRTAAQPMPFDVAVKTFLTSKDFTVCAETHGGLELHSMRFDSKEYRQSELAHKAVISGEIKVKGYLVDLAVRQAWIEVDGKLTRVDAKLPYRGDEEQLYLSLFELEQYGEEVLRLKSMASEQRHAAASHFAERVKEEVGVDWFSGRRKPGRPKQNAASKQEANNINQFSGRKSA